MDQDSELYRQQQKRVICLIREIKQKTRDGKCKEVESYVDGKRQMEVWRFLRNVNIVAVHYWYIRKN